MLQDALHDCLLKTDKGRTMLTNSLFCFNIRSPANKKRGLKRPLRAENGTRTRDLNLGKVALYQLSYFRNPQIISSLRALK